MSHALRQLVLALKTAVLSAVAVALSAAAAYGSCGDYVLVGPGHGDMPSAAPMPRQDAPCHGPHCSSRESLPVVPAVPPRVESTPEWLLFDPACLLAGRSGWCGLVPADQPLGPQILLGGVFRPPPALLAALLAADVPAPRSWVGSFCPCLVR